jgi:ribonuclease BN (tRNA processing enzyme)
MVFEPMALGATVAVGDRSIRSLPANHTVPAVGFHLYGPNGALAFSGDSWPTDEFWRLVNAIRDLRFLIIETAFSNRERDLAIIAKHLYPIELGEQLKNLRADAQVLITHLKPSDAPLIAREIDAWAGRAMPRLLERGQLLEF